MAPVTPEPADPTVVAAHTQQVTHHYTVVYPPHEPRDQDPHIHEFREYKRRRREAGTYHCDFAAQHRGGDTSECDTQHPLEAHHTHVEFAVLQGVDLALLEADYPGISSQDVGAWLDSDHNLTLLCVTHHRGHAGVHTASAADYEALKYVRHLIT